MTINSALIPVLQQYKSVVFGDTTQAVIAAGQSASSIVDSGGMQLLGLVLPSTFVSSNITFTMGFVPTDVNYPVNISPDGSSAVTRLTLTTCTATNFVGLQPAWFSPIKYFIINTSASQTSGCIITCLFTPIFQGIHG